VRLAHLIAAAELCVAPSSVETFGLSAIEALASGVPLLAADRGGVAEMVERSGAGTVFETGSPDSVGEKLIELMAGDLRSLGARGRAYCEREHDWNEVLARLFRVYDSLAAR
jgi:glycosyltransferase involved in cell wall biosynthesis